MFIITVDVENDGVTSVLYSGTKPVAAEYFDFGSV
jgi:hypothetical protein